MTLQDLIDELSELPVSARTATVSIRADETDDFEIMSVSYQMGEAFIIVQSDAKTYETSVEDGRKQALKDAAYAIENLS